MDRMILGSAVTGAKFTPRNPQPSRDPVIDAAASGMTIKHRLTDVTDEAKRLADLGCRYWHYHARNPKTNEQTTSNSIYQSVSNSVQEYDDAVVISFGASRNGPEVKEAIRHLGEWERVSQAALPLHMGGAHFVTTQAAVELQVIIDLERQHGPLNRDFACSAEFSELAKSYVPTQKEVDASLVAFSTANGANYGSTSPATQLAVFSRGISERNRLHLPHEIEWVQLERSYLATRFCIERPDSALGSSGQLNITLLFGFSPTLPFPHTYAEFLDAVNLAKSLEYDHKGYKCRHVTVSVGAAVIPQHASRHCVPMDIGVDKGRVLGPLQRIVHYACQPDAQVDIIRSGMEDTPYHYDVATGLALAGNVRLLIDVTTEMRKYGYEAVTEKNDVNKGLHFDVLKDRYTADMDSLSMTIEQLDQRCLL